MAKKKWNEQKAMEDELTSVSDDINFKFLLNQQLARCMKLLSLASAYRMLEFAQASYDAVMVLSDSLLPLNICVADLKFFTYSKVSLCSLLCKGKRLSDKTITASYEA